MPATYDALQSCGWISESLRGSRLQVGWGHRVRIEMAQNSLRYSWSRTEVDARLRCSMNAIYDASIQATKKFGLGYDLIAGNNIAAFERIAKAMLAQGM